MKAIAKLILFSRNLEAVPFTSIIHTYLPSFIFNWDHDKKKGPLSKNKMVKRLHVCLVSHLGLTAIFKLRIFRLIYEQKQPPSVRRRTLSSLSKSVVTECPWNNLKTEKCEKVSFIMEMSVRKKNEQLMITLKNGTIPHYHTSCTCFKTLCYV